MSLIGKLEQFSLSSVLQRVEIYEKTGLLTIKQQEQVVDFYFKEGRLLCVSPLRTSATLGERLLHDGIISLRALQEAVLSLDEPRPSETRIALALMNLEHVSREELRAWAMRKAVDVLKIVLPWSSGEIYFDDDAPAPADRLLVSMFVSSLLESASAQDPVSHPITAAVSAMTTSVQDEASVPAYSTSMLSTPSPDRMNIANGSIFVGTDQLIEPGAFAETSFTKTFPTTESLLPNFTADDADASMSFFSADESDFVPLQSADDSFGFSSDFLSSPSPSLNPPIPVTQPVAPRRIDTSFMRPDMVLMPIDLSALRDQNRYVQLTPDQWRLLTRVDGQTSLQTACQELAMLPELVCQVAGELIAEGLIYPVVAGEGQMNEFSPVSRELASGGLNNGYLAPGYAIANSASWSPAPTSSDVMPQFSSGLPFETESQWGNGGNGATFVPGRGWIATPQPLLPMPSSGSLTNNSGVYAQVGGFVR